jgi:hypothetical protein
MSLLRLPRTVSLLAAALAPLATAAGIGLADGAVPAQAARSRPCAPARAYSVPPAHRLVVSFRYRDGARGARTLVRFTRNRLALLRSANGRLVIDASRRRSLTTIPRERHVALHVVLDVDAGQVTAQAGRRRIRIAAPLTAERRVVVARGACLTRLNIKTSGSDALRPAVTPRPSAAPSSGVAAATSTASAATTSDPATSSLSPATPDPVPSDALFAGSLWNARLANDAPLDPASSALVNTLQDTVAQDLASHHGPWIATNESSTPLYRVGAGQPLVRVQVDTGWWGAGLQQAFEAVPLPDDARPASGSDGHMAVWQPSTDRFWEFFHMRWLSDGWHADFGGAMQNVSTSPGYYDRSSWPGLSETFWGASASSLPLAAGLMRIDELKGGEIRHALSVAIPSARAKTFSWPAQRTDGVSNDPNAIPEGARFRLDPTFDLGNLNLPRMTLLMAQAVQRYGMIVVDQTGWAVGFAAEDPTPTGSDPYYGEGGLFGGLWPSELLAQFPWQHLQLLKMQLRSA